jgi:FtsP/CotA-like multicopper oxidase with cupredoxin domain
MKTQTSNSRALVLAATALLAAVFGLNEARAANHAVTGLTGAPLTPSFNLVAAPGYLSTPEGNSLYFWGYGATAAQYSGPTLIVNQGDVVTVTLQNQLPVRASMVFPGQGGVSASGGDAGLLTREPPANPVPISIKAARSPTCRSRWGWWGR